MVKVYLQDVWYWYTTPRKDVGWYVYRITKADGLLWWLVYAPDSIFGER